MLEEIREVLENYVSNYGIAETHEIRTMEIYQQLTEDIVQTILDAKLTAVFVASRRTNCTELTPLFQVLPFFYVSGSSYSCDSKINYNRIFYMFPPDSTLMSTMLSALVQYQWSSAAVLYEENDEVQYTFQDMQEARSKGVEITAFEATGTEESIREKLIQARRKGSRTYILVCSYTRLLKIMTVARALRLSTSNNHWFIPSVLLNPLVLHDFLKDGVHITFLHSPLVTPLTLDLLTARPSLSEDGHELFSNIVKSLVRIAMRSVIEACSETARIHEVYKAEDGICFSRTREHGVDYKICGADVTKSVDYNTARKRATHTFLGRSNHSFDDISKETSATTTPTTTAETTTISKTKRIEFDESCIIYTVNITDFTNRASGNSTATDTPSHSGTHSHGKRRKRETTDMHSSHGVMPEKETSVNTDEGMTDSSHDGATVEGGHSSEMSDGHGDMEDTSGGGHEGHNPGLFEVAANFDPCPYASVYHWKYRPDSCSHTFTTHLKPLESNAVFIIEHVHSEDNTSSQHELLAVGGYNSNRGVVGVTYPPFKISHIVLPKEPFVLGVVWNPPWLSWEYDPVTKLPISGTYEGFLYDLIVKLSLSMGFNFTFYHQSALDFGKAFNHTDKQLEAEMNFLFNNDTCDMFLMAKTIHGGRIMSEKIVGLTTSFQQPKMYLLTKRVERNDNVSIWQFLTPFQDESWVFLYMSLLLVSLLMTYINKKNPNEFRRAARDLREGAKPSEHMGIMNSLWFNFASLVEQSSQLLPRSASMKVMSGIWWFFVMLVVSAYTANMISFMTQSNNAGITTLEELVSQQEFEYGMLENNAMLTKFLPDARDEPYSSMWDKIDGDRNHTVPRDLDDALSHVRTDKFIFIATYKELVQAITESCEYDKVGDGFYKYQYGLPVPLGWQFLPLTNDYLQRLYDDGTISELETKWFGGLEARCETDAISPTAKGQLDLKAFIGMYVLLILGVASGIIICIFETSYIKYGGMKGFLGKAKKYEFRKNHIEHQRPDKVMEKEFDKWTGGWEVIRHRPFLNTLSEKLDQKYPHKRQALGNRTDDEKREIDRKTDESGKTFAFCPGCGHEEMLSSQDNSMTDKVYATFPNKV